MTAGGNKIVNGTYYYIVPFGLTSMTFEVIGGGGCGGTRSAASTGGAAGGGGGGCAYQTFDASSGYLIPGSKFTIVVGKGGELTGSTIDGTRSEVSWDLNTGSTALTTISLLRADGGTGVALNSTTAGTGGSATGSTTYTGGNGSAGGVGASGAGGGGAGSTGNGGNAAGTTAGTGTAANGGNGGAGITTSGTGNDGFRSGGGGGGAFRSAGGPYAGGKGFDGGVYYSYVYDTVIFNTINTFSIV